MAKNTWPNTHRHIYGYKCEKTQQAKLHIRFNAPSVTVRTFPRMPFMMVRFTASLENLSIFENQCQVKTFRKGQYRRVLDDEDIQQGAHVFTPMHGQSQ